MRGGGQAAATICAWLYQVHLSVCALVVREAHSSHSLKAGDVLPHGSRCPIQGSHGDSWHLETTLREWARQLTSEYGTEGERVHAGVWAQACGAVQLHTYVRYKSMSR